MQSFFNAKSKLSKSKILSLKFITFVILPKHRQKLGSLFS